MSKGILKRAKSGSDKKMTGEMPSPGSGGFIPARDKKVIHLTSPAF
ncbi:hypothetical protein [Pantoea stewartii]|nr:hypothetical protein [Pantoea stewartii]